MGIGILKNDGRFYSDKKSVPSIHYFGLSTSERYIFRLFLSWLVILKDTPILIHTLSLFSTSFYDNQNKVALKDMVKVVVAVVDSLEASY